MKRWNTWVAKLNNLALLGLSAASGGVFADTVTSIDGGPIVGGMNIQPAASKIAEEIHGLNVMILSICAVIGVIVFGVMIYSMIKFRKSKGAVPVELEEDTKVKFLGREWTIGPTTLEIGWTIIPFLIVIGMALPATKTMVAMKDTSNADLTIKVTGYQWKWGYEYMDGSARGVSFIANLATPREQINNLQTKSNDYLLKADQALVVPVGKKVRIVTTAADVIHAWMIPRLGIKIDAIPGIVRDSWFKADKIGMYYGQCVELCGKEHAFMPINVNVVSQKDFDEWAADKKKEMAADADDPTKVYTMDELTSRGQKVYEANCAACHQVSGMGGGGSFPKLNGSPIVLGPKADQMKIMLNGKNLMSEWATKLSDVQLASVMTFTRNHWDNKTGELIQPSEFAAARGGVFPEGGGTAVAAPAPETKPATETAAPVGDAPEVSGNTLKVFFAVGSTILTDADKAALDKVASDVATNPSSRVEVSGYVDSSGSADKNAELAKNRAFAVRDYLKSKSVDEARIDLKKPNVITGGADKKEARRVEITVVTAS